MVKCRPMRKVTWAVKMEIVEFYILWTVCYLKTGVLLWFFFASVAFDTQSVPNYNSFWLDL
jgi:hypothetical protein